MVTMTPTRNDLAQSETRVPPDEPTESAVLHAFGTVSASLSQTHLSFVVDVDPTETVNLHRLLTAAVEAVEAARLKKRFQDLAARWRERTGDLSSAHHMIADPDYLSITALGRQVVPFILEDLQARGGFWYPALEAITQEAPETPEDRQTRSGMRQAWLRWGQQHGIVP